MAAALLACRKDMERQFDKPTMKLVGECLVRFDALALHGFKAEMVELRAMKDPEAFAIQTLKGK